MQIYDNTEKESSVWKRIVLEILDFLRFKIENDKLTMEEMESISRTVESGLNLTGTIDDFARFYGKPKENVKVVINRKVLAKPSRHVLYPFRSFMKARPKGWK